MAEKIMIEVEGRFTDHISDGASKAELALKRLCQTSDGSKKKWQTAFHMPSFDLGSNSFLQTLNTTEQRVQQLMQSPVTALNRNVISLWDALPSPESFLTDTQSNTPVFHDGSLGKSVSAAVLQGIQSAFPPVKPEQSTQIKESNLQKSTETITASQSVLPAAQKPFYAFDASDVFLQIPQNSNPSGSQFTSQFTSQSTSQSTESVEKLLQKSLYRTDSFAASRDASVLQSVYENNRFSDRLAEQQTGIINRFQTLQQQSMSRENQYRNNSSQLESRQDLMESRQNLNAFSQLTERQWHTASLGFPSEIDVYQDNTAWTSFQTAQTALAKSSESSFHSAQQSQTLYHSAEQNISDFYRNLSSLFSVADTQSVSLANAAQNTGIQNNAAVFRFQNSQINSQATAGLMQSASSLQKNNLSQTSSRHHWQNTGMSNAIHTTNAPNTSQFLGKWTALSSDVSSILQNDMTQEISRAAAQSGKSANHSIRFMFEKMMPESDIMNRLVKNYQTAGKEIPTAIQQIMQSSDFTENLSKAPNLMNDFFTDGRIESSPVISLKPIIELAEPGNFTDILLQSIPQNLVFSVDASVQINWSCNPFDAVLLAPVGNFSFSSDALITVNWEYERFNGQWLAPDSHYTFTTQVSVIANWSVSKFTPSKSMFGIPDFLSYSTTVRVTPNVVVGKSNAMKQARGGIIGPNGPTGFSDGGMVRGGPQLITVAEEGTPEMIIPLGSQRRQRALNLWEKAGHLLGVQGYANGGIAGSLERIDSPSFFEPRQIKPQQPEPVLRKSSDSQTSAATGVTIEGGIHLGGFTLQVNTDNENNQNIVAAVEEKKDEIMELLAEAMLQAAKQTFVNLPLKGGQVV